MERLRNRQLVGKRVLVTGASGFIGSHLCRELHALGAQVLGVSRVPRHGPDHVRWTANDLTQLDSVDRMFRELKPDLVYHLAGFASAATRLELVDATFESILVSTKNVLVAAAHARHPRVVLVGSLEEPQDPDSAPASPYGVAKWAAGTYGRMFNALYQVPVVTTRLFMTYGPGQRRAKILPHVITSLLQGRAPELASGRRQVDWIYVDDVVSGMILAGTAHGIPGATIDLGSGTLVTIREVVETIARLLHPSATPLFGAVPDRPIETTRVADVAAAARLIGWQPRTSLEEGLTRTVAWYREQLAGKEGVS